MSTYARINSAPGIKYILDDKNIIHYLHSTKNQNIIKKKNNYYVSCFGGLFESFYSSLIFNRMTEIDCKPYANYYWCGNSEYKNIIQYQGIAQYSDQLNKNSLDQYPLPIIFGFNRSGIFNCLYNYDTLKDKFNLDAGQVNHRRSLSKCINRNMPYKLYNIPFKFINQPRSEEYYQFYQRWAGHLQKFILVIPDRLNVSLHDVSYVDFTVEQWRELQILLKPQGINLVMMSRDANKYKDFIHINYSLENYFLLINRAWGLLSNELDFTQVGIVINPNLFCMLQKAKQKRYRVYWLTWKHRCSRTYTRANLTTRSILEKIISERVF